MNLLENPVLLIVLWVIIYSYLIFASVDFGANFYLFYGQVVLHQEDQYALINDYLSPLSEVVNIVFVLLFATLSVMSQEAAFYYRTPLAFSGILSVALSMIKGTFFAVGQLTRRRSSVRSVCLAGSGLTGVLIPAAMSIAMVVSEGGFSDAGLFQFLRQLTGSFYFWTVIVIALVSVFYIGAMFLILLAHACGKHDLENRMRNIALFWSMPNVMASAFVFLGLLRQNPNHFMAVLDHSWLFLMSLVCLLLAVTLVFMKKNYLMSFLMVMLQYFFALWGYAASHLPYIIYPDIRVSAGMHELLVSGWLMPLILVLSLIPPAFYLLLKTTSVRQTLAFRRSNT